MRNLKKLVALIVTIAMMATLAIPAFAAAPADVVGTEYESAVTRLVALNIITGYPNGDFGPADGITRAEFAAVIIRALGHEDVAKTAAGTAKFSDVPSTHWAAGYIGLAVSLKIVKGYTDGKFGPNDKVTYDQAVAMIIRALGAGDKAEAEGGYPLGYMLLAKKLAITTDVAGAAGQEAPRGIVALLVNNSLKVTHFEKVGDSTWAQPTVEANQTNFLKGLGKNELATGIVTEVTSATKFKIGATEYTAVEGSVDTASLLGKKVTLWGAKAAEVVLAEVVAGAEVVVKTVDSYDAANSVYKVTLADGTKKDYKVAEGAGANYNLKAGANTVTTLNTLIAKKADEVKVSLIVDGDKIQYVNGVYFSMDTVATGAYVENKVAKTIKVAGYTIKNGDDSVAKIVVERNGEAADYTAIAKGDVLFIAENLGDAGIKDDYIYIKATDAKVTGKFESADSMTAATWLKVDGTKYDVSQHLVTIAVATGDVTVTLDPAGKAYSVTGVVAATTDKFGVLIGYKVSTEYGVKTYGARILTVDGEKVDYVVTANAATAEIAGDAVNYTTLAYANKLAKYTLDSNGKITAIEIADDIVAANKAFNTTRMQLETHGVVADDVAIFKTDKVVKVSAIEDGGNIQPIAIFKNAGNTKVVAILVAAYDDNKSDDITGIINGFVVTAAGKYVVDVQTKDGVASYVYEGAEPAKGNFIVFQLDSSNKMTGVVDAEASQVAIAAEKLTAADSSKITVKDSPEGTYWYADDAMVVYDKDQNGVDSVMTKAEVQVNMEGKLYLNADGDIILVVITKM